MYHETILGSRWVRTSCVKLEPEPLNCVPVSLYLAAVPPQMPLKVNVKHVTKYHAQVAGYVCLHTLLIQKTIASSRSNGSSLEALKVEKRLTEATTFSMLIISTV